MTMINFEDDGDFRRIEKEEAEETERLAKEQLARLALLEDAFENHFSEFFPFYLHSHGPETALNMIGKDAVRRYLNDETIAPLERACKEKDEEIAGLKEQISELESKPAYEMPFDERMLSMYREKMSDIMCAANDMDMSAEDFREYAIDAYLECENADYEMEMRVMEEEGKRQMEEDKADLIFEQNEDFYRGL